MSLEQPFRLTVLTENGEEPFPYDTFYFDSSPLALSLRDMYLGTSKEVIFRLYNEVPQEYFFGASAVLVTFDLSEAFTFFENVRYDTTFGNSLRDFLKIYVKVGAIGSDIVSQNEVEISSVFHANIDNPVVGIIFSTDTEAYQSMSLNTQLTGKYLLVPYFPNPGEFVSFAIGVKIPNKFTEDFLVKALGFPGKQGVYKTPISSANLLKATQELQTQNLIGGTSYHQKLINVVGPVGLDEFIGGDAKISFTEGIVGRVASRGYMFLPSSIDVFSNVQQKNLFTDSAAYFSINPFSDNYYEEGLPDEIVIASDYHVTLIPGLSAKPISDIVVELASLIPEALTYYKRSGEEPDDVVEDMAGKLLDVGNYHVQNLLNFTNTIKQQTYVYRDQAFYGSQLTSFEDDIINIAISGLSHAYYSLFSSLPEINPTYSLLGTYDVIDEQCLTDYFHVVTIGQPTCDFRLRLSSIWSDTPNSIAASTTSMKILGDVLFAFAEIWSTIKNILSNQNVDQDVKDNLVLYTEYFRNLYKNLAIFTVEHLAAYWDIINENSQSGASDIQIGTLDSSVFYAAIALEASDFILGDYMSLSKQFWSYLQKLYFYRGVYTNTTAMLLTKTKPAPTLADDVVGVLNDIDGPKTRRLGFLSNVLEKESEKLISLKMFVQSII